MKKLAALLILVALFGFFPSARAEEVDAKNDRYPPKLLFEDTSLDFELRRILGAATTGGADVNEVLYTAAAIEPGDSDSWYEAWFGLGERIYGIGAQCLENGHPVSAREAFLRASMYYRAADFYLHGNPDDPRILEAWQKSRDSFRRGAALLDQPVETVRIPYEQTTLPGYIFKPDQSDRPRKTLIIQTGFDGTAEELYFTNAVFALQRGYNVVIFEGPGQGGAVRDQHLYFRPDWEKVVIPVVDFILTRPEFDPNKLALLGISMGGYFAPRAAAHEHRLAALIANGGIWDMSLRPGQSRAEAEQELEGVKKNPDEANQWIREAMKKSVSFRWSMENGMFTFGVKTPAEFALALSEYHMDGQAELIRCPTLIVDSLDDQFLPGQPQMLYDALTGPKTMLTFSRRDMASSHCQEGAGFISNQRILDWLDETLENTVNPNNS